MDNKLKIWTKLKQKFCVDLKRDFSNKDVAAWLGHFVPDEKITIYQNVENKTIKIYTGSLLKSLLNGRISAKLMASLYFKKLAKQNYSHSDIELLGILFDEAQPEKSNVLIRFLRYNTSGKMYDSAKGLYTLTGIENSLYIKEMSIYADNEASMSNVDLGDFWRPDGLNK